MKYLAIILLSFAFFHPALAAKEALGAVPQVRPLQPAPAGISPGFNKNIQSGGPQTNNGSVAKGAGSLAAHSGPVFLPAPVSGYGHWAAWLAAFLAAGIFGLLFYKRNKT